jgi:hypothetical protein
MRGAKVSREMPLAEMAASVAPKECWKAIGVRGVDVYRDDAFEEEPASEATRRIDTASIGRVLRTFNRPIELAPAEVPAKGG